MTQVPLTLWHRSWVYSWDIMGDIGYRVGYIWKREEIVAGACLIVVQLDRAFHFS